MQGHHGHSIDSTIPHLAATTAVSARTTSAAVALGPKKLSMEVIVRRVWAKVSISSGSSEPRVQSRIRIVR